MTPEQRAKLNSEGNARGCTQCPICGDSIFWKAFHETITGTIDIPVEVDGQMRSGGKAQAGVTVVCEECWPKLSMDQRIAAHAQLFERRRAAIRSPRMRHTGKSFEIDPVDQTRHDMEHAAIDADFQAIKNALAG